MITSSFSHHIFKDTFHQQDIWKRLWPLSFIQCWNPIHAVLPLKTLHSKIHYANKDFPEMSFHSSQPKETLQLVFMTGCPGFKESNRLPRSPSPTPLSEQQEKRRRRALHRLPPPHSAPPGIAGACGIKNGTRWQTKTVLSTSLLCCLLYCQSMKRPRWGTQ